MADVSSSNSSPAERADQEASSAVSLPTDTPPEGTLQVGEPQRLHPMTLLQRVLVSLPALAFLLLPLLRSPDENAWISLFAALVYGFVALPLIALRYYRFRYQVTPKEIIIEHGVLKREHRSIPIERVQNIQIIQSLVPRLFGTAKVKIETAGSQSTEGVLEYVGLDEARHLRQVVRTFQRQKVGQPSVEEAPFPSEEAEEADTAEQGETLFRMPLRRVLLSGAFRFSLLYIAFIFSGFELLGFDPEEMIQLFTRGPLQGVAAAIAASPGLMILLSITAAALLGWLTGIAINLNRYYGFQLWLENGKLQKKHGLLTLSEGTIPLEKVQALILRTSPLMRYFGFYRLELQTMGVDAEEQGYQVAVPFAKKDEVLQMAHHIRPVELPEAFASVSPLTIRRAFIRYTVVLLIAVLPVAYFWQDALWGLLALPLIGLYAFLRYKNLGYALPEDDFFFVCSGVVKHYIWALPTEKQQVFYTSASPFQRRLGLKSLYVDTAGAAGFAYPEVVDLPASEAEGLLERLYARFQVYFSGEKAPGRSLPAGNNS